MFLYFLRGALSEAWVPCYLREVLLLKIPVVFDDGDLSCAPGIRHLWWLSRENWNQTTMSITR
jgi:hypothetical protein